MLTEKMLMLITPASRKYISLSESPLAATFDSLQRIGVACGSNLTSLNLSGCHLVDDLTIAALSLACQSLSQLNLTGTTKIKP